MVVHFYTFYAAANIKGMCSLFLLVPGDLLLQRTPLSVENTLFLTFLFARNSKNKSKTQPDFKQPKLPCNTSDFYCILTSKT